MKCLCIGICQLGSMVDVLRKSRGFSSIYDQIVFYPVFEIDDQKMKYILEVEVPGSDLILSQPVSDNYKNTHLYSTKTLRDVCIKNGKTHYVVSNCYFTGYDPVPFQITDANGEIIKVDDVSYFPSQSFDSLINGDAKAAAIDWCMIEKYSPLELANNIMTTLATLKERENKVFDNEFGVDIRISDYIEENFKKEYLFHTYNHPTNIIIIELVRRLSNKMGIHVGNLKLDRELLGSYAIPPPPSVYYGYGMTFNYPKFIIANKEYGTYGAMQIFTTIISRTPHELRNRWKSGILWGVDKLNTHKNP
jgi:hypothetical protein